MTGDYEILEHTADAKFRATGDTLENAFRSAVDAFSEIVSGGEPGRYHHEIEVESESLESLLFDFLDRLIFVQETEEVIVAQADELEIEELKPGYRLKARLETETIDPGSAYQDIKAPTYNEMKVEEENSKWVIEAVLDI